MKPKCMKATARVSWDQADIFSDYNDLIEIGVIALKRLTKNGSSLATQASIVTPNLNDISTACFFPDVTSWCV